MLRLKSRQREALAETFRELANYGVAALVFGQFVGGSIVSWKVMLAGVVLWLVFVAFALVLERE